MLRVAPSVLVAVFCCLLAAAARAQSGDHVVLTSGHHLAGTVLVVNEKEIVMNLASGGRVTIPKNRVVGLYIASPAASVSTGIAPTVASTPDASAPATALPAGTKMFSAMPGDVEMGKYPTTGPLNPLNDDQWVAPEASSLSTSDLPQMAFLQVRYGYNAVMLEIRGDSVCERGGSPESVRRGLQVRQGDRVEVRRGVLTMMTNNLATLNAFYGTKMQFGALPESNDSTVFSVEAGHCWAENRRADIVAAISTPHGTINTTAKEFALRVDNDQTTLVVMEGRGSIAPPGGQPVVIDGPAQVRLSAGGTVDAPTTPSDAELAAWRRPSTQ